jgi:hypothetical protein
MGRIERAVAVRPATVPVRKIRGPVGWCFGADPGGMARTGCCPGGCATGGTHSRPQAPVAGRIDRACQPIERRVLRLGLRQGAYVLNRDVVLAALWFDRGVGFRTRSAAQLVKTPRVEAMSRLPKVPASAAVGYLALSRLLRIARASATHLRLWVAFRMDEGSR